MDDQRLDGEFLSTDLPCRIRLLVRLTACIPTVISPAPHSLLSPSITLPHTTSPQLFLPRSLHTLFRWTTLSGPPRISLRSPLSTPSKVWVCHRSPPESRKSSCPYGQAIVQFGPISMADSFSTYSIALRPRSTVPNGTDTETPEQGVQ